MVIRNSGSAKLQFQLEAKASGLFGAWFSAEPSTGELQPEANVTITVTYDAGGLRTGRYSGGLVIKSNALNDWVSRSAPLPPSFPLINAPSKGETRALITRAAHGSLG